jgi:protein-S-isoprenylcysteine O-methyltransferase
MTILTLDWLQDRLDYSHCKGRHFKHNTSLGRIAQTAAVLGTVCGIHLCLGVVASTYWFYTGEETQVPTEYVTTCMQWCAYMTCLTAFHLMEYFATALNHDDALSDNSFVVNHSKAYTAAALASWIEYWIETYLASQGYFPLDKKRLAAVGFAVVVLGNIIRFHGMTTCGKNFSHLVMTERRDDHRLVTTGIYKYLRHPAYFGWFYWSIGTQVLLGNPLCTLAYAVVSWQFFAGRIPNEEAYLKKFYGDEYRSYRESTVVGIPFLK